MKPELIPGYVDASAALVGLPLSPEHRAGVVRYFAVAAAMAELVMQQPLGTVDEPAALFVPVMPVMPVEPPTPAEAA